jgi:UDP-N-acetylmuramate--alanine ligase
MIDWEQLRHIHCIGIGGIGLSAIAAIFLSRGYQVTGSDMNQNDKVEELMAQGAGVFLGHREKNVLGADLVVYSAAVTPDNPELAKARSLGIPTLSRAEVLGHLMAECPNSIAISGTHGKTTTTSMVSLILQHAGLDPTILVGGNLAEIGGNVRVGKGDYFVTEACEYMDSFLELKPRIEIILNIDSDHLDYFKDIEHIASSFERFARLLPEDGILLAYDSNPFVSRIIEDLPCAVTFGFNQSSDYYAKDVAFDHDGMPGFTVCARDRVLGHLQLAVPGEHNILNALASLGVCDLLGVPWETIRKTLESYTGTQRRFDLMGETNGGVKIVDDYAHHPTEIKATLSAAANTPHRRIWCLFQPHTYTRTLALLDEFPAAFEKADILILAEIYGAREKNVFRISSRDLLDKIRHKYPAKEVLFFPELSEIAGYVCENACPGDLVITMGAGDIYKAGEMILEKDAQMFRGEKSV